MGGGSSPTLLSFSTWRLPFVDVPPLSHHLFLFLYQASNGMFLKLLARRVKANPL